MITLSKFTNPMLRLTYKTGLNDQNWYNFIWSFAPDKKYIKNPTHAGRSMQCECSPDRYWDDQRLKRK